MDLSIIILNWKVKDLLRKCLTSVYQHTSGISFEVFVVDNDSRDGSVEMVLKEFPQVTLIANNRNVGFAAGNNQAIEQASGEFVLLLNPDTELKDNALAKMVSVMTAYPLAGVCGPKLLNPDGSLQSSVRRYPTFWTQALVMLKLHHVLTGSRALRRYLATDFDYAREQDVEQVMGAAFMIRCGVLTDIGPLDEDYFIWFEEVDYCKRARDAGYQVLYTPQAEVIHHGGESFAQAFGPLKQRIYNKSMRIYMRRHHGFWPWLGLTLLHPLSMALAWGVHYIKP
ncbi:MAG: glycosyltransferase family 2 protein [Patescibacteria group bacterium]